MNDIIAAYAEDLNKPLRVRADTDGHASVDRSDRRHAAWIHVGELSEMPTRSLFFIYTARNERNGASAGLAATWRTIGAVAYASYLQDPGRNVCWNSSHLLDLICAVRVLSGSHAMSRGGGKYQV